VRSTSDFWGLGEAPSADICAVEMGRLVAWARAELDSGEIPALFTIAVFLRQFLALRPFADANGRLARVLAVQLLVRAGYEHLRSVSLESAVESRRDECASALRQSAADDVTPWLTFFLSVVADTQQAVREARASTDTPVLGPRQERILAVLQERGAVRIGEVLAALGIPRATAKKDLKGLLGSGFVVSTGVGKGTVYRLRRQG
jgi:Fic family protein